GWDPDEIDALNGIRSEVESLRKRHADDPPHALLRAAQHDALPSELQEDARAYLSTHAWGRALVEGLDAGEVSLAQADQDRLLARIQQAAQPRESEPRAAWWLWPVVAASAFAVLLLGVWMWRGASVTQPPSSGAPASSQTTASSPLPPATPPQARE